MFELGTNEIGPFVVILMIAAIVAIIAKYLKLPYTIALVISGLVVGLSGFKFGITLTKELIFFVLLPPLLFDGALRMRLQHLLENWKPISVLAVVGVSMSIILVGVLIHYLIAIPLPIALLLSALIMPIDATTVLALFKEIRVPQRLRIIVEGESIFDDGIAIVIFGVILGLVEVGEFNALVGLWEIIKVSIGGLLIGLGIGYVCYKILQQITDRFIEVMITVILAFGIFGLAESLHLSGIIAVVTAGLVLGNYGRVLAMSPSTRFTLTTFWEFAAFVVNSVLFILIGMEIQLFNIYQNIYPLLLVILAILACRALNIFSVVGILNRFGERIPKKWRYVMTWGCLRGAIPIALVLGIPKFIDSPTGPVPFPYRDLLLTLTFGVVLFSLTIQGLTLRPILNKLGFLKIPEKQIEEKRLDVVLTHDTAQELEKMYKEGKISETVFKTLNDRNREINLKCLINIGEVVKEYEFLHKDECLQIIRKTLISKKNAFYDAWEKGLISDKAAEELIKVMDRQIRLAKSEVLPRYRSSYRLHKMRHKVGHRASSISDMKCIVCLDRIRKDDDVYRCKCGTLFHKKCIQYLNLCPACTRKFEKKVRNYNIRQTK